MISSYATLAGATIAFLISRYILRDFIQRRFSQQIEPINQSVIEEGRFYLFSMRMIPVFPFFIINNVMAMTPIKTIHFVWVTQLGMFLPTLIFANAGTRLANIDTPQDILSIELLFSLAIVGFFPICAKKVLGFIRNKKNNNEV